MRPTRQRAAVPIAQVANRLYHPVESSLAPFFTRSVSCARIRLRANCRSAVTNKHRHSIVQPAALGDKLEAFYGRKAYPQPNGFDLVQLKTLRHYPMEHWRR